ncbi:MAG: hypothetical protein F6K31_02840 [Symploca sp. SIO2G7]|nr:hypothetical protein [Symploca sp. SIO2G7]
MIKVEISSRYESERRYILSVIFGEFLGLDIQIKLSDRQDTRISVNANKGELVIADGLFSTPPNQWLQLASLPRQPLKVWNIVPTGLSTITVSPEIPVIYGNDPHNQDFFQLSENKIYLGLDIFGSAFFMLTRYEEIVKPDCDQHDRFPAHASLAYQEGFLERPIINEYLEILWAAMKQLWPKVQRKPRELKTLVSCDVDNPYSCHVKSWKATGRKMLGDIIKRHSYQMSLQTAINAVATKLGNYSYDPLNTFDWIMDVNEQVGNKVAFFFLAASLVPNMDSHYNLNEPRIRALIRKIHHRGHEIGLHGSYSAYQNQLQLQKEADTLRSVLAEENIDQGILGFRQHYLRWNPLQTHHYLDIIGLDYDTTLGYAAYAGFRCGICYEYPMYDFASSATMKLYQRPLVLMECSVIDKIYMGLGCTVNTLNYMNLLKSYCCQFNGNFTVLWHNNFLQKWQYLDIYQKII